MTSLRSYLFFCLIMHADSEGSHVYVFSLSTDMKPVSLAASIVAIFSWKLMLVAARQGAASCMLDI
jgi:hypothetical protein